jgi:hypothetical protein
VFPLEGGVALLDVRLGGLEEGVAPLGGVTGGVVESPLRCAFFGGLSGGLVCFLITEPLTSELEFLRSSRWRHCCSVLSKLSAIGVPILDDPFDPFDPLFDPDVLKICEALSRRYTGLALQKERKR